VPRYVVERRFLVPIFEHVLIEAEDLAAACRVAIDDYDCPWGDHSTICYDDARPTTVATAVELPLDMAPELRADADFDPHVLNDLVYQSDLARLPIPAEFKDETRPAEARGFI
jgi:hypothetical protein